MLSFKSYQDEEFNEYLLSYIKERLLRRSLCFKKEYSVDGKTYQINEIIESLTCKRNMILFGKSKIVKYLVYDLSQRYWLEVINATNNQLGLLYLRYKKYDKSFTKSK